jgi:hypothetical protein
MSGNRQKESEANRARTAATNHNVKHNRRKERMEPKHQCPLHDQ